MIRRRKPLVRQKSLARRRVKIARQAMTLAKRIARISKHRSSQRQTYTKNRTSYLREHPYCMIFIFRHQLNEEDVIANYGYSGGRKVPRSNQIHHRGKSVGEMLNDERWWMACSFPEHDWVENHKNIARELGLLLPIQANSEGRWGAGNQAWTTPELMFRRANGL